MEGNISTSTLLTDGFLWLRPLILMIMMQLICHGSSLWTGIDIPSSKESWKVCTQTVWSFSCGVLTKRLAEEAARVDGHRSLKKVPCITLANECYEGNQVSWFRWECKLILILLRAWTNAMLNFLPCIGSVICLCFGTASVLKYDLHFHHQLGTIYLLFKTESKFLNFLL